MLGAECGAAEQFVQIRETRDPIYVSASQQPPKQDHQSAIGQNEIGLRHRASIRGIALQPAKTSSRWRDDETAMIECAIDGAGNAAVEKIETENLHEAK